jgi:hypothetical protein
MFKKFAQNFIEKIIYIWLNFWEFQAQEKKYVYNVYQNLLGDI